MEPLKTLCANILTESITVATVIDVLLLAIRFKVSNLKSTCIDFITENARDVTHTKAWENMAKLNPMLNVEVVRRLTSKISKPKTSSFQAATSDNINTSYQERISHEDYTNFNWTAPV